MSNPYDQNPQSQPSGNPYEQPGGQYPPSGQQYPSAGQQYPASQPSPYGQPPAAYGQQPYGQQPYGAAGGEHPQGTMIFVLGIVGIFVGICAPIAWYLGNKTLREVTASGANYSNVSQIRTGRMLGKVFTIIYIVFLVLYIIAIIAVLGMGAGSS